MINPEDYVVMKLFHTADRKQVCLDLRNVSGIIQKTEELVRVCFGSSEVTAVSYTHLTLPTITEV